jgi:hypothetical protein
MTPSSEAIAIALLTGTLVFPPDADAAWYALVARIYLGFSS